MSVQDYDIGQEVGRGGFATVYRAVERRNGKECALKVVQKDVAQKKNMLWRVRNEIQIHMQLDHPSIVKLYTHFEDEQCIYLVLELCAQGDLYKFLRKRRHGGVEGAQTTTKQTTTSLNDQTQSWLRQLAEGIAYLHSKGIIHRDLKLSNILLSSAGKGSTAKIADFGLAVQLADPAEEHYTLCGTPNYIAPEVMNEDSAHSFPADLWSLGCIFYTLMVGRPPFRKKKISEGAKSLTKVERVSVPASLDKEKRDLLLRLLNPSPQSRISAEELVDHPILQTTPHKVILKNEIGLRHGRTETSCTPPLHERRDHRTHLFDTETENKTNISLATEKAQYSADQTDLEQIHGQTSENRQESVCKHASSLTDRPQNSVRDGHRERVTGCQDIPTRTEAQNGRVQTCTQNETENARGSTTAKAGEGGLNKSTAKDKRRRSKDALLQGSRRDSSQRRTRAQKSSKTPQQRHKQERRKKRSSFRTRKSSYDAEALTHSLSQTLSLDWDNSSQPSLSETNTDTDTAADRVLHSHSQMYGHRYTRRPVRTEVSQESGTRRCARKRSMPKKNSSSSVFDSLHPQIPVFPSSSSSSSSSTTTTSTISTTIAAVSSSSPHSLHEHRASGAPQHTTVCYSYSMPCRHSCEDSYDQLKTQNGASSHAHARSASAAYKNVTKRRGVPSTGRQRKQHTADGGIVRDSEIEQNGEGAKHSSHFTENFGSQSNRESTPSTEMFVDRSVVRPGRCVCTKVYRVLNVREADLEDDHYQQQQKQQRRQIDQLQAHLPHHSSPQKETGEVGDHSIPLSMQRSEFSLASKNLSIAGLEPFLARTPWGCAVLGNDRVLRVDFVSQATCLVFWPSGVEVGVGVINDELSQSISDIALKTRNRRHSDTQTQRERLRQSQHQRLGHGHSQTQSQSSSQSHIYKQSQTYIQGFDSFFSQTVPLEAVRTSWKDGVEGLTVYALARLPRSFTSFLEHTLALVEFVKRRSPKIVLRVFPVIEKSLSSDGTGGSECNAASASARPRSSSSSCSSSSPTSSSPSSSASAFSTASSSSSTYSKLAETNWQQSRSDGAQSNSQPKSRKAATRSLSEPLSAADVYAWGHSSSSPALHSTFVSAEPVFECHLMQNGPLPDFSMTCDDGTLLSYELQKDQLTVTHDIKTQQTEQQQQQQQTQEVDEELALAPKEKLERDVLPQAGIGRDDPTSAVGSHQHLRPATTTSDGCSSNISSNSSEGWFETGFQARTITKTFHLKDCLSWTSEVPSFYWNLITLAQRMLQICMDMELQVFASRDPPLRHAPRNKRAGGFSPENERSLHSCVQCCGGNGGVPAVRHIFLPSEELALWPPVVSAVNENEGSKLDASSLLYHGEDVLSESLQDAGQALHARLHQSVAGRTLPEERAIPRKNEVDVEMIAGNLDVEGLAELRRDTAQAEASGDTTTTTAAATAVATSARNMSNNAQERCILSRSQIQTGCQEDDFFRRYVFGEAESAGTLPENMLTKHSYGRPESTLTAHTEHISDPTEPHQEDPSFELFDSTVSDIVVHDETNRNVESATHELSVCSTASTDTTADSFTAKSPVDCLQVTMLDPQNGVFGIHGVGQAGLTDGGCLRITFHDSIVLELDETASWLTVEADDVYKFDLNQLPVESYLGEQQSARSSEDAAKAKLIATGRLKYLQELAAWMSTNVFCV